MKHAIVIEYTTAKKHPRLTMAGEATGVGASIVVSGLRF